MRTEAKRPLAIALVLTLLGGLSSVQAQQAAAPAAPAAPAMAAPCTLKLDLATVHPAPAPVVVLAVASQALGDSLGASVAMESGVSVVSVKAGAAPNSAEITLDTSKAVAGDWDVSLWGTKGKCAAKVSVKTN